MKCCPYSLRQCSYCTVLCGRFSFLFEEVHFHYGPEVALCWEANRCRIKQTASWNGEEIPWNNTGAIIFTEASRQRHARGTVSQRLVNCLFLLVLLRCRIFQSVDIGQYGANIPVSISIFVYVSGCGGRRMRNGKFDTTDRPTNRPRTLGRPSTIVGGRAGVGWGEVDWSTAQVKGNFDEFHNQWLTLWHSYQIADLFNCQNITGLNH